MPATPDTVDAMAAHYHETGYVIAEELFTPDEVADIREEAARICRGERGEFDGLVAADGSEQEVMARYLCIHFPHKISEKMLDTARHPKMADMLTRVIGPNVKCMQSMLFVKHAGKPGQAWHQDEFYIPTRDRSLCGGWIALDDATVENGCLWVIPGSHKHGVIWPQRPHNSDEFDGVGETYDFPYDGNRDAIAVEVPAGSVVFFHGYLLHRSLRNRAREGFRRALVCHYMSAESMLPWNMDGRIDSKEDMRDIFMVAGEDPYAYKGIEELSKPFLRPE